jgi:hypothetical protein
MQAGNISQRAQQPLQLPGARSRPAHLDAPVLVGCEGAAARHLLLLVHLERQRWGLVPSRSRRCARLCWARGRVQPAGQRRAGAAALQQALPWWPRGAGCGCCRCALLRLRGALHGAPAQQQQRTQPQAQSARADVATGAHTLLRHAPGQPGHVP